MKKNLTLSEEDFSLFQKILIEESGLYFERNHRQSLQCALEQRIQKRGHNSCKEYYNLLKFHPEGRREMCELLDLLTVGETYFFRNKPHFEVFMKFILLQIIEQKMNSFDQSIRIWSAGCSKGDEAYSIVIAIMEVLDGLEGWDISILGTDINRDVLDQARKAVYDKKDIRSLPDGYLKRYFKQRGTRYILNDEVKKFARFQYHNLAKDSLAFDEMQDLDVVFCRNVTIYFNLPTMKRIIENFHGCLSDDGYLFIGHSETLWKITNKFQVVEFPQAFIYKKALHPIKEEGALQPFISVPELNLEAFAPLKNEQLPIASEPIKEPIVDDAVLPKEEKSDLDNSDETDEKTEILSKDTKWCERKYKEAVTSFNKKDYEQALILFDEVIRGDQNFIRAYLGKATILANQGKYKEAIEQLSIIVGEDNLYIEAYFLLGTLFCRIKNYAEAEKQFRKVIYINSDLAMPYFNLGNIYLRLRKFNKAAREFTNAIQLLEERDPEKTIKFAENFSVTLLIRACKNNLDKIKQ